MKVPLSVVGAGLLLAIAGLLALGIHPAHDPIQLDRAPDTSKAPKTFPSESFPPPSENSLKSRTRTPDQPEEASPNWERLPPRERAAAVQKHLEQVTNVSSLAVVKSYYRREVDAAMRIEILAHLDDEEWTQDQVDFLESVMRLDSDATVREAVLMSAAYQNPVCLPLLQLGRQDRDENVRELAAELIEEAQE